MEQNYLTPMYIVLIVIYLTVLFFAFYAMSIFKRNEFGDNKLFMWGFVFKVAMGLGFGLIYDFYYQRSGDTFYYFANSCYLGDMLFTNTHAFFRMLFDTVTPENINTLSHTITYYPRFHDPQIYALHRYLSLFTVIGLKNYYLTTICVTAAMFLINWKVYKYLADIYPSMRKWIAVAILFIPSVTFWSSGITKDTFSFTFGLLFFIKFHAIMFRKKWNIWNILALLFSAYIVITIKPYILFAYIAAGFIWLGFDQIDKIKNKVLRVAVLPLTILLFGFVGMWALNYVMASVGGSYGSIESMLQKAAITQYDLKQEYYEGSSFDIGDFEPTIGGALSVMPAAAIAGLFRPFLWDSRSLVMILSALENTILLVLFLYVLFKVGARKTLKIIQENKFLIFCFIFALFMAIGVGLSTSNFGALVRFKIPITPFLFLGTVSIIITGKEKKENVIN
ncbi:MAG TPA: hypothetical protein PKW37_00960 [Salinivirgaceae bacterium]|nr:hypothetical protein [Salinivirgaceae bacterium]